MKTKTINKILCKKFHAFKNSITDKRVRQLVEENTMITGGCITSMLLNEPVNDFDMYFRNKETVFAVAQYYVDKFGKGSVEVDGDRVKIFIKSTGFLGTLPDDFSDDLPKNKPVVEETYAPVCITSNAITLSNEVQLILRFWGEPNVIHSNYDFAHCLNYWTSCQEEVFLNKEALECTLAKELRYTGSKYPLCSIFRTRKFITRGWHINAGQYLKMALQLNELDLLNIAILEDQLTGVDSAYFLSVIEALKEKEHTHIDQGYLTEIINKIF